MKRKRTRHTMVLVAFLLCTAIDVRAKQTPSSAPATASDSLATAIETARRTRNEAQLQFVKTQLEQRVAQNAQDWASFYDLARVQSYFVDVYEARKDKKGAEAALDKAIDTLQHSLALNDKSADAHSLLADLYGRKISFGGMFSGAKLGPKITDENKRAMALDDKNARVWASLGRQYLMAPKMFGGDTAKAIESFQKSLRFNPLQDETWAWLAKAYLKQSDKAKAREAIAKALQLNPQSGFAMQISAAL
jgi:tetratricopeptide (TPR) repeat protein